MKTVLAITVGTLLGWFRWGFVTGDYSFEKFFMFFVGMLVGNFIGKRTIKRKSTATY